MFCGYSSGLIGESWMRPFGILLAHSLPFFSVRGVPTGATSVKVAKIPNCDFCKMDGVDKPAEYDGKTYPGPWAYMCKEHFLEHGIGLGLGRGQKLEVQPKLDAKKTEEIPTVEVPLNLDDVCEVQCPHCGESRTVEPDANYVVTCEGCGNKYEVISAI